MGMVGSRNIKVAKFYARRRAVAKGAATDV